MTKCPTVKESTYGLILQNLPKIIEEGEETTISLKEISAEDF